MTYEAYIIMPVGSDPAYLKKRAAIEVGTSTAGYTAYFPLDESPIEAFELVKTREHLTTANAVIVDLTMERPSCYYELGLAQALNSQVFVFAERGTRLHQLFGRERVCFYESIEGLATSVTRALERV